MQRCTINDLKSLADWTAQVIAADYVITELVEALRNVDMHHAVTASIGNISVSAFNAHSVHDILPFLRAVRKAGFKRQDWQKKPKQTPLGFDWYYERAATDTEPRLLLTVHLYLRTDSAARCRTVVVGQETVDVTKTLCGDELDRWEAEHE